MASECVSYLKSCFEVYTHKSKEQIKIDGVLVTVNSQCKQQDKGPDSRYQHQSGTEKWMQWVTLIYVHSLKCSLHHLSAIMMWWIHREDVGLPFVHKGFNGIAEHEKGRYSSGDDNLQWKDGVDLAEEI